MLGFFVVLSFSHAINANKGTGADRGRLSYHAGSGLFKRKASSQNNSNIAQFLANVFGALGKKKVTSSASNAGNQAQNVISHPVSKSGGGGSGGTASGFASGAKNTSAAVRGGAMGKYGLLAGPGRAAFMASARSYEGSPYVWGAEGPRTFDCTGYLTDLFQKKGCLSNNVRLTSRNISSHLRRSSSCKIGDVISRPGHAALNLGDGRVYGAVGGNVDRVTEHSYRGTCYENPCFG